MWGTQNLSLFLLASFTLTMIPGPSTLYILGRSISQGRKAGVVSVLGIGSGSLCHTVAVSFGLSALLAASQAAFSFVKFLGAAYLIYLGIQMFRKKSEQTSAAASTSKSVAASRIYGQGLLTQILNPKVTLFFVALLPQLVAPMSAHSPLPFLFLGVLFVTIDTIWFCGVAFFSAGFTNLLRRNARFQSILNWATGLLYIGLGLNLLRAKARLAS